MTNQSKQTNPEILEKQYLQELDNSIITYISSFRHISTQEAMDTLITTANSANIYIRGNTTSNI